MPVMATIMELLYTMAIAPYSRGGFLYGLPYDCQVSAGPCVLQCAKSGPYPPVPYPPCRSSVCGPDPQRRCHDAARATPPAAREAPSRPHGGSHPDDRPRHLRVYYGGAGVWSRPVDDQYESQSPRGLL